MKRVTPLFVGVLTLVLGAGFALASWTTGSPGSATAAIAQPSAVDVGFSQDMAVHHEQAVEMAVLATRKGSPGVRSLATTMELSQARESGAMRGWLQLWGQRQLPTGAPMTWMEHAQHGSYGAMAGMASRAEITALAQRAGRAFDVMFLQLMIRHHQGGVRMAQAAVDGAAVPVVRHFAEQTVLTQNEEISLMRAYLMKYNAEPLP